MIDRIQNIDKREFAIILIFVTLIFALFDIIDTLEEIAGILISIFLIELDKT